MLRVPPGMSTLTSSPVIRPCSLAAGAATQAPVLQACVSMPGRSHTASLSVASSTTCATLSMMLSVNASQFGCVPMTGFRLC